MHRIGLYGGSFDPVHRGHLLVAQAALEELELERLYFIPAARSPFKPDRAPAPAEARLRMLRLALAGCERYRVDGRELARGGVSFTIDTVRAYQAEQPKAELYYLIGADHLSELHRWREADELALRVCFVVIPRPGERVEAPGAPFRVKFLRGHALALSSSEVRERVRGGLAIRELVPGAVAEDIASGGYYDESNKT